MPIPFLNTASFTGIQLTTNPVVGHVLTCVDADGTAAWSPISTLSVDLDVNGNKIVSSNNGDIELRPDGTGKILLTGPTVLGSNLDTNDSLITSNNNGNVNISPHGTGQIILNANVRLGGTLDTNNFDIVSSSNQNITLTPHGSGLINLNGPVVLGGDINVNGKKITSASNGDVVIEPNGSGLIRLQANTIALRSGCNLGVSDSVGTKIGTSANQRLAFYGATPIPQPASAEQRALVNNTGGNTSDVTLAQVSGSSWSSTHAAIVNDNFARIALLLNRLREDLVSLGLIKGNA